MSQQNFFFSTIQVLKLGSRIDSKCKFRSLNLMLDNNGNLRSCGRLQFAPDNLEVEKFSIKLHAKDKIARLHIEHAHNNCIDQRTEPVKVFVQKRYHIIGLRKNTFEYKVQMFSLQTVSSQNIQPVMAPLPACRFPTDSTQYLFANSGVDCFGSFYIEGAKGQIKKHYDLIFTCLVTRWVHPEACPDLNTDTFLNAYRLFVSRRCQPTTMLSDNSKTFFCASKKLKRYVKSLDNDKIHKAVATTNTTWKLNPPYGPHFGGIWERLIQTAKRTLLIVLGSRRLSLDVFRTILVETEAILNSRPLTIIADFP